MKPLPLSMVLILGALVCGAAGGRETHSNHTRLVVDTVVAGEQSPIAGYPQLFEDSDRPTPRQ